MRVAMSVADLSLMAAGGYVCSGLRRRDVSLMAAGGDAFADLSLMVAGGDVCSDYADAMFR